MRYRDQGPVHVVVPPVEWDIISAPQFEETLDSFPASSAIQVDCAAVAFMDSAGLNSLIRAHDPRASKRAVTSRSSTRRSTCFEYSVSPPPTSCSRSRGRPESARDATGCYQLLLSIRGVATALLRGQTAPSPGRDHPTRRSPLGPGTATTAALLRHGLHRAGSAVVSSSAAAGRYGSDRRARGPGPTARRRCA